MKTSVFARLKKEAQYALNSHSRNLVYETYGKAKMAYELKAISHDEFYELNTMLVVNGLNNLTVSKLD